MKNIEIILSEYLFIIAILGLSVSCDLARKTSYGECFKFKNDDSIYKDVYRDNKRLYIYEFQNLKTKEILKKDTRDITEKVSCF